MPVPVSPPLSESDYEAIAAAVMETSRGRWFLAEFARRNRHADTTMLLSALQRLERVGAAHMPGEGVRSALLDMARTIERMKAQIAAVRPEIDKGGGEGTGYEFDAIVHAHEHATSDILAAAEHIQDMAWTLREQGVDSRHCEFLQARATEIYSACSLLDLTAQRIRRVVQTLRVLESRIDAVLSIWGGEAPSLEADDGNVSGPAAATAEARQNGAGSETSAGASAFSWSAGETPAAAEDMVDGPAGRAPFAAAAARDEAPSTVPAVGGTEADAPMARRQGAARDPLAALRALTPEEKLALFS
ncbi:MAG: hypothetical protein IRZ09_11820 [Variibacter sp.]|nr:hypothetical protein [Variibacter sp.]